MIKQALAILAVFVVVVPLFVLETHGGIGSAAEQLRLVPQNERFTEVYFSDAALLPKVVARRQPIAFSFVISNQEGTTTVYPFEIYVLKDGVKVSLQKSWLEVASGAASTTNIRFTPHGNFHEMTVYVNLPSVQEQLHFSVIEQ